MTCESVAIVRGEDRNFYVRLIDKNTKDYFDLTGWNTISAKFAAEDGSYVTITLADSEIEVVSPATIGKLKLIISDAKTALLKIGNNQKFEVILVKGSETRIIQLQDGFSVIERI